MQRPEQLSHPQQVLVAQVSQNLAGFPQVPSDRHASSQELVKKLQASPEGQASSSSQRPAGMGMHALRQSLHPGHEEVAHPSHT